MPSLFDPLKLGALTLPNRILMAPLTRARAGRSHIANALMAGLVDVLVQTWLPR